MKQLYPLAEKPTAGLDLSEVVEFIKECADLAGLKKLPIIAGGCIRDKIFNLTDTKDIDVFIEKEDVEDDTLENFLYLLCYKTGAISGPTKLSPEEGNPYADLTSASSRILIYNLYYRSCPIQVIVAPNNTPIREYVKRFDYSMVQCMYDIEEDTYYVTAQCLYTIRTSKILISDNVRNKDNTKQRINAVAARNTPNRWITYAKGTGPKGFEYYVANV